MATVIVFDPVVFDSLFDTVESVPTLYKVSVSPQSEQVAIGQDVAIMATFVNSTTFPHRVFKMNLSEPPRITLYNPDATVKVYNAPMVYSDTGEYTYVYQSSLAEMAGPYTATFAARHGSRSIMSRKMVLFKVFGDDLYLQDQVFDSVTFNATFDNARSV